MPQIIDPATGFPHKMCPVRSFEDYIGKLNPDLELLWQQPKKKIPKDHAMPWYQEEHVGHNPLDNFMSKLAKNANLSPHYTNHCIRVSGATNLTTANFMAIQIMSVTGHKSLQSLSIYQKVKDDEKLMMGMSLTFSLLHPNEITTMMPSKPEKNLPIQPATPTKTKTNSASASEHSNPTFNGFSCDSRTW